MAAPAPDPRPRRDEDGWVLGVDSGGSGLRIAVARVAGGRVAAPARVVRAAPVRTGPRGIDADHLLRTLVPAARSLLDPAGAGEGGNAAAGGGPTGGLVAAAVGAAGMAGLGEELRAELPGALEEALGVRRLALAADAVTAYAGALGVRPGVVVAAGTGAIALGTDLRSGWRRADGWGHLLGDCGSGAWIGRAGLEAALRAHDGRAGGSPALLERLRERFGAPGSLPAALYPRSDRPAVLASFAPDVAGCADRDPVAAAIMERAARHLLETAAAARPPGPECAVAFTGGLLRLGPALLVPLGALFQEFLPDAVPVAAGGDPLDGALRIAATLSSGGPALPDDPLLLRVVTG
ncbi:BadF/BadG/BcrA/BcrD ATPase family protein [Streptomyces thermolineatus]|uniref:BadF/BadG/BcrA/BcrD ATPase family protein n=1 Tax=Streptomyces thermolineatus TaxID=44033 RepID=A0ABN3L0Z8_9ACTN